MTTPIEQLLQLMARLRDPEAGCPWDREQTFHTIAPYTIEEAYEVADAIEREAWDELRGELGDLLFQVVFHSRMAEERQWFDFGDVVQAIVEKMTRRHPHVFGDAQVADAAEQTRVWEEHKAQERLRAGHPTGILDGIPANLPAMTRAVKLQKRAVRAGFDWPDATGVLAKIREEIEEVEQELAAGDQEALEGELGDLLFACVNLARHAGVEPESALRRTNSKFERRFRYIEQRLRETGADPSEAGLAQLDALWEESKTRGY